MNKKFVILAALALVIVAVAVVISKREKAAPAAEKPVAAAPVEEAIPAAPVGPTEEKAVEPTPAPVESVETKPEAAAPVGGPVISTEQPIIAEKEITPQPPEKTVKIYGGQVLATVNTVPVTLKDLVPLGASEAGVEREMTEEQFESRLNRAIDAELAAQEAKRLGVVLTPDQEQRLLDIRDRHHADIESYKRQGQVWTSVTEEQIDFQVRFAEAILLQVELLKKAGLWKTVSDADVKKYYEEHTAEYGELPADPASREMLWQQIDMDIRQKLDAIYQAANSELLNQYMGELRAKESVTVSPPA